MEIKNIGKTVFLLVVFKKKFEQEIKIFFWNFKSLGEVPHVMRYVGRFILCFGGGSDVILSLPNAGVSKNRTAARNSSFYSFYYFFLFILFYLTFFLLSSIKENSVIRFKSGKQNRNTLSRITKLFLHT